MKRIFTIKRLIIGFIALILLMPVVTLYLLSENKSRMISAVESVDPKVAKNTKKLFIKLRNGVLSNAGLVALNAHEQDLNHLFSLASRGSSRINGRANVSPLGVYVVLSIYVPENPFGDYINISTIVLPSDRSLVLDNVQVGRLQLKGKPALALARIVLNLMLGSNLGSQVINSIQSLKVSNKTVKINYRPIPDLKQQLALFRGRVRTIRSELNLGGDLEKVRFYYKSLCEIDKKLNLKTRHSFDNYLSRVFQLARQHSGNSNNANEYRSAILAMGIYFGTDRLESVVGEVRTTDLNHCKPNLKTGLAGRRDLLQHFIVSAGLKVLSDNGMPYAIGELKELLDSARGGSGFSFADLAADRAGLKFSEYVSSHAGELTRGRKAVTNMRENSFFPDIQGLPEKLTDKEFVKYYKNVNSVMYDAMLADIDKRINSLPLYQLD